MRTKLSYLLRVVAVLALLSNTALPAFAQNATGAINGTVKDQNDAVVANATVTLTNKATSAARKLTTN
ncbi:MAG TPA: carboxypeptidase-like regulatory domain-containing protein, partial [Blastocatellia bacterium]|nr:carboxypeptidase-like regulatory domain-containing protein [Blastocatellia bacterium]